MHLNLGISIILKKPIKSKSLFHIVSLQCSQAVVLSIIHCRFTYFLLGQLLSDECMNEYPFLEVYTLLNICYLLYLDSISLSWSTLPWYINLMFFPSSLSLWNARSFNSLTNSLVGCTVNLTIVLSDFLILIYIASPLFNPTLLAFACMAPPPPLVLYS